MQVPPSKQHAEIKGVNGQSTFTHESDPSTSPPDCTQSDVDKSKQVPEDSKQQANVKMSQTSLFEHSPTLGRPPCEEHSNSVRSLQLPDWKQHANMRSVSSQFIDEQQVAETIPPSARHSSISRSTHSSSSKQQAPSTRVFKFSCPLLSGSSQSRIFSHDSRKIRP